MKSNLANTLIASILSVLLVGAVAIADTGCLAARQATKTAIDVALAACLAEHADIDDESELRKICQWADDVWPLVRDLLAARRRGLAKARALASDGGACSPDGGR